MVFSLCYVLFKAVYPLAVKHISSENCFMKDQHKSLTLNRREQLIIGSALLENVAVLFKTNIVGFSVWIVQVPLHSAPKH